MRHLIPSLTSLRPLAAVACALISVPPGALAQSAQTPAALPAQRVVIDPATGRLRMPESDETVAPATAAPSTTTPGAVPGAQAAHPALQRMQGQPVQTRLGAVGKRLEANRISYSSARKDGQGQLHENCVSGDPAHAPHAGAADSDAGGRHDH